MHLNSCPPTSFSAWCSLTTMPVSHGPAFPTLLTPRTLRAKRALPSTLSKLPTAPTESKAGTHETNKSTCPSKAVCLSMSVTSACGQCCPVSFVESQTDCRPHLDCLCTFVWMCMYVSLVWFSLQYFVCFPLEQERLVTQSKKQAGLMHFLIYLCCFSLTSSPIRFTFSHSFCTL